MIFVFSNIEVMDVVVKSIFDAAKEESFAGGFKIIFSAFMAHMHLCVLSHFSFHSFQCCRL